MKIRLRKGYTKTEFAKVIGVTRQTISNWEKGKTIPSADMLFDISNKIDVPYHEIMNFDLYKDVKVGPSECCLFEKVKVGRSGHLTIPKEMLQKMDVWAGDELLLVGDRERGIELLPADEIWEKIIKKYSANLDNSNNYCYYNYNK